MNADDLLLIAQHIDRRVKTFIPFASNKNYSVKKEFLRSVSQSRYPNKKTILEWNLNLTKNWTEAEMKKELSQPIHASNTIFSSTLEKWCQFIGKKRNKKIAEHKNGTPYTYLELIENAAKNAVRYGIGNCYEDACLAAILAMEFGSAVTSLPSISKKISIEILKAGDHGFVVLNRNLLSNLQEPENWGDDCVILDSWMGDPFIVAKQINRSAPVASMAYILSAAREKMIEQFGEVLYMEEYFSQKEKHSKQWIEHRNKKNEPERLGSWSPRYWGSYADRIETIPWKQRSMTK